MQSPNEQTELLRALRALRWPVAGVVGLVFALGRVVEGALLTPWVALADTPLLSLADSLLWGLLAAVAVWAVLSWAARQERRYRAAEARMLAALRETNADLELLNEINQRLVTRASLDEILDYAITLPARLIGARGAALVLCEEGGAALTTRTAGVDAETLAALRAAFAPDTPPATLKEPIILTPQAPEQTFSACVLVPLVELEAGSLPMAPAVGWIEAYLDTSQSSGARRVINDSAGGFQFGERTRNLLVTVAGELAEAVVGQRRRGRELANLAALERAITEERTRIARDLHDGIAQSLAFMRMRIALWEDWLDQEPQQLRGEFSRLKENLREQIEELRRAIFALRPIELSQLGFEGALRRFVTEFAEEQGWHLHLDLGDLPHDLPHLFELAAFRVVQEALNNSAKHARATAVSVMLRLADGGLQIVVRDNGVGFDPGKLAERDESHLGLRQMRERAAALDGQLTVMSRPGEGSEVRVWLPIVYLPAQPV